MEVFRQEKREGEEQAEDSLLYGRRGKKKRKKKGDRIQKRERQQIEQRTLTENWGKEGERKRGASLNLPLGWRDARREEKERKKGRGHSIEKYVPRKEKERGVQKSARYKLTSISPKSLRKKKK